MSGAEIPLALAATEAASVPLTGAEIGAAGLGSAGMGMGAGLAPFGLGGSIGANALSNAGAEMLGAASSGAPGIGFGTSMSPTELMLRGVGSKLGSGLKAYGTAKQAMGLLGGGSQQGGGGAAAPMPPQMPVQSAGQIFGRTQTPGMAPSSAGLVGGAMGGAGGGGMSPQLMQLLMKLQQQGGM